MTVEAVICAIAAVLLCWLVLYPLLVLLIGSMRTDLPMRPGAFTLANFATLFANAENRDRFQVEPERSVPEYGGYCVYAVSKGRTASIDPEAWKIVDRKLYLNYSKGVQRKWEQDVPGNIGR